MNDFPEEWDDYNWDADQGSFGFDEQPALGVYSLAQPLAKHVPSAYDVLRDKYWQELKQWLTTQV